MNIINKDIVIIGAGITGLTTGHHINKINKNFVILEKASKVGGVIKTSSEKGFTYEEGPNTAILGNVEVNRLFADLKNECELEIANNEVKKRYILKKGKWKALPMGVFSAITTPLFSLYDKFRILGEPFRAKGTNPHETLEELVLRRMGKSFLNYAIDPFILGVYAGDPSKLIPKYALPKLYNLEHDYGSFIKGAMKKRKEPKTDEEKKVTRDVFTSKGGLATLTDAIRKTIGDDKFLLSSNITNITQTNNGYQIAFTQDNKNFIINTKKIITTTGSHTLQALLPFIKKEDMLKLNSLVYAKVVEIVLGFKNWTGIKLDGFGGLIPHKENRKILGIMFMSSLIDNRAPKGGALFSIFLGGIRRPDIINLSDSEIENIVKEETMDLLKISEFKPEIFKIIRHYTAIPQYGIESGERFKTINKIQNEYKGLIIGGNIRDGIGMADRILQARELADSVL